MMYFGPRKLLFSQINLHKNNQFLLAKELAKCTCYRLCPPECNPVPTESQKDVLFSSPTANHKKDMPTILVLMLCVLGVAFFYLCYLTIFRRYRTNLSNSIRRNSLPAEGSREVLVDENQGPAVDHPIWYIRTVGLQQSVIDSIAVIKYKKGEDLIEGSDCSVCLSEFEEDENLRLLPKCSHAFHITCIDTWLRSHKNCPLCRAPIVRDTDTSTDTPHVDALQSALDNLGSREDSSVNDEPESDEVGEDGVSELRIGVENIGPLSNEEGKILKMLKRGSDQFIAKNNRARVLSDLADHRVRVEEALQPVRRSFSMDLSSASMIYAAVAKIHPVKDEGGSNFQDLAVKKQTLDMVAAKQGNKNISIHRSRKSFSFGRSLQSVPIHMKRSSSGKILPRRHSRSQELVQTL